MDSIRGLITKVIKQDDEKGSLFAEVRYETGFGIVNAKLNAYTRDLVLGDFFMATGSWQDVPAKGRFQGYALFKAKVARPDLPNTKTGAMAWFGAVFNASHGADPDSIRAFVERHGDKVAHLCEKRPDLVVGVSRSPSLHRDAILAEWGRRVSGRQADRLMEEAGVDSRARGAILDAFRDKSYEVLRTNPYKASRVKHVGFGQADRIGRHVKIDGKDDRRVAAAVVETLMAFRQEGSTFAGLDGIGERMDAAFGIDLDTAANYIARNAAASDAPFVIEERDRALVAALRELRDGERRIASRLGDLLRSGRRNDPATVARVTDALFKTKEYERFDEVQRAAVAMAATEPVSILTGGPGTGKSTVSEVVVAAARKLDKGRILLCAPTGKAAKRLEETTRQPAATIHTMLEARVEADGVTTVFKRNAANPLPQGCVVVVDEASMVDVPTMAALLDAMPPDGRLVLVGDRNQLPSVDAGAVLGDMLRARTATGNMVVPSTELVQVYRQSRDSAIALGAAEVRQGRLPFMSNQPAGGLVLYEHGSSEIVAVVKAFVERVCLGHLRLRPADFVVLSPQAKGTAGTWEINRVLSDLLNPRGKPIPGAVLGPSDDRAMPVPRVGDRVMLTENDPDNGVMNGDVGAILDAYVKASPSGPARNFVKVRFDCGKDVEYPVSRWRNLILAYAMTIHKSQGSQYNTVVMPVTMAHHSMLDRALLYTGWTRAKSLLCLVGEREAIEHSVRSTEASTRDTMLVDYLGAVAGELRLAGTPLPRVAAPQPPPVPPAPTFRPRPAAVAPMPAAHRPPAAPVAPRRPSTRMGLVAVDDEEPVVQATVEPAPIPLRPVRSTRMGVVMPPAAPPVAPALARPRPPGRMRLGLIAPEPIEEEPAPSPR